MADRRGKKKRQRRNHEELRTTSEHLEYEFQMLVDTARAIDSERFDRKGMLHRALVESHLIHTRNMLDFLYPDPCKARTNDVIADDYFDDPDEWEQVRPRIQDLGQLQSRISKLLAHLTYYRQKLDRNWYSQPVTDQIVAAFEKFLHAASETTLNEGLRKLKGAKVKLQRDTFSLRRSRTDD